MTGVVDEKDMERHGHLYLSYASDAGEANARTASTRLCNDAGVCWYRVRRLQRYMNPLPHAIALQTLYRTPASSTNRHCTPCSSSRRASGCPPRGLDGQSDVKPFITIIWQSEEE